MIDAVLSQHHGTETCGVTKFNVQLAARLRVPHWSLDTGAVIAAHPLLSVKFSEWTDEQIGTVYRLLAHRSYAVFLHDADIRGWPLVARATRVYAANEVIAAHVRPFAPAVTIAWCPSTVRGDPTRGPLSLLACGMAHKLIIRRYQQLYGLLAASGQDYTISVSTAVHEGSPWTAAADVWREMREIFGSRFRTLGYLADDALSRELDECAAVVLFYDPAVRANNTTFWAAVDADAVIVTTLDAQSPTPHVPHRILNIDRMETWPDLVHLSRSPGWAGVDYSWEALVALLGSTHGT